MSGDINIQDFVKHLKSNGLVIVRKKEFLEAEAYKLEKEQKALLNNASIPFFKLGTDSKGMRILLVQTQTIKKWAKDGNIPSSDWYLDNKGRYVFRKEGLHKFLKNPDISDKINPQLNLK